MSKKLIALILALSVCFAALTGCQGNIPAQGPETAQPEEKTVILGESFNFEGGFGSFFDPSVNARSYSYTYYVNNFYETLVEYRDGEISPCLATEWEISPDGLVYAFKLREDVKFSDGSKFNAESVKIYFDNMRALLAGSNDSGLFDSMVKEVKVKSNYEVEFHMTAPYYAALNDLAMAMPRGIMAPSAFNGDGTVNFDLLAAQTLGTGPYMYTGQNNNHTEYTFVRNPHYYGEKPDADKVIVKVIPEANNLALRNGEIHMIIGSDKMSYDSFIEMKEWEGYTGKVSDIDFVTEYLSMNSGLAPFDELKVRLAVHHAIDKDAIVNKLYYGLKTKADTIMSTDLPYCDITVTPYQYDPEKSKALLSEAGWADTDGDGIREKAGQKLSSELKYPTTGTYDKLVLALQSALKEIGMELKLTPMDLTSFFNDVYGGSNYRMTTYISYWIPYDPYIFVANMNPSTDYSAGAGRFSTDPQVSRSLANMPYEEAHELINSLLTITGDDKIREVYHKALTSAHESSVLIPIDYLNELVVYNSSVVEDYAFNSIPNLVDISLIKLK